MVCFANFFVACFVASNFCQSNEFGVELCTAGFCVCSDFNCPFNCRKEKGAVIRGAMNSVSTNKTVPRKTNTPVISNKVRRRGQRLPSGSENTNGVSPGGTSSGIRLLICPDYKEVRTGKRPSFQVKRPLPLPDLAWHNLRVAQAPRVKRPSGSDFWRIAKTIFPKKSAIARRNRQHASEQETNAHDFSAVANSLARFRNNSFASRIGPASS